jgi:hypothetical protein
MNHATGLYHASIMHWWHQIGVLKVPHLDSLYSSFDLHLLGTVKHDQQANGWIMLKEVANGSIVLHGSVMLAHALVASNWRLGCTPLAQPVPLFQPPPVGNSEA